MAAARRELGDRAVFVLLGAAGPTADALATWTRLLAEADLSDTDVTVVFSEGSWNRWATLTFGPSGSIGQPAMIIVGPTGDVAAIFGDGLPTPADLRLVIDEATP